MAELSTMSTVNPWSTQDNLLGMRLGDPQSALTLAKRHGLLDTEHKAYEEEVEIQLARSSSLRMIRTLKEISKLDKELQELELEINRQLLDKEMADFVHTDILERRLWRVDMLLNHLTEVMGSKDAIVGRLQSRAAENSLKIEAPFQKHTISVLSSLGQSVTSLPSHCGHVEWIGNLSLDDTTLKQKLSDSTQSLVQCRSTFQQCQTLHNVKKGSC